MTGGGDLGGEKAEEGGGLGRGEWVFCPGV